MPYPVSIQFDSPEGRNRLTVFFRYILAIPHLIFVTVYGLVFFVVVLIAWLVLLFTARWPESLYRFAAGYLRYSTRLSAYLVLLVDAYPPFSGAEDDAYPVRVQVAPPKPSYSRVKVFFRYFYALLAMIIAGGLAYALLFAAFLSWFNIVFVGRQAASLRDALKFSLSYATRSNALVYLVTETYPPLSESAVATA